MLAICLGRALPGDHASHEVAAEPPEAVAGQGQDLLYVTTVGAKTGQKRQSTVARFPDGEDAWLVVASAGGSARHPAWYHNIAAHPDQVWIEFGGHQLRVTPTQLDGDARAQAWQRITQLQPRYAGYEQKTDRAIPVIRLSRAD